MTVLVLQAGASEVSVFPAFGASLGGWRWHGVDLLYGAPDAGDAERMACFPMVPFANRIARARLPDGALLTAHPGELHSLHGVGWKRAWEIDDCSATAVQLSLRHRADGHWPFDFRATLAIELAKDQLVQTLALTNTDTRPMPAGLGFHPFFPVDGDTVLNTALHGIWDVAPDHLPTGFRPVDTPGALAVRPWAVNNCFTGWSGRAELAWHDRVLAIESRGCGFLQCYRPGGDSGFVAIEPATHVPNAHHLRVAGIGHTGLQDLGPSHTQTASMTLLARRI